MKKIKLFASLGTLLFFFSVSIFAVNPTTGKVCGYCPRWKCAIAFSIKDISNGKKEELSAGKKKSISVATCQPVEILVHVSDKTKDYVVACPNKFTSQPTINLGDTIELTGTAFKVKTHIKHNNCH